MAKQTVRPRWPVIDMHGQTYAKDPTSRVRLAEAAAEFGVARILLLGDVLAFGYHPTPEQIRIINDATASDLVAYPDLYYGLCHVNPENPADFIVAEITRCVKEHGFRGVKMEATVNARDRRLDPIMETARSLGVFVLHHSWYQAVHANEEESTPADIANLAARFPDVQIVMAHLGGARIRGVLDIRPFPNIWIDTSGSQPMGELVEYAVEMLGADRIVYGSDVPGRDFSAQIGRVWGSRLGLADKKKILHGNAARLLGEKGGKA